MKAVAHFCCIALFLAGIEVKADDIDFTCSLAPGQHCQGSVSESGTYYQTTGKGIVVFNDFGPYSDTVPFMLSFNSATDEASIDGTGVDAGQNFIGTLIDFSVINGKSSTAIGFDAEWLTVPKEAQEWLGTEDGMDTGFVITTSVITKKKNGSAGSTDVLIQPVPEPGSLVLVGSGLLVVATALRRKARATRV